MRFTTPLGEIKGVGPKTEEALSKAGLFTVKDLIYFLPRTYEDYSEVTRIDMIKPGNVVLRGRISTVTTKRVRRGLSVTEAVLSDDTGRVPLVWFNQPYREKQLKTGGEWLVSGEFAFQSRRFQILNPSVSASEEVVSGEHKIVPVYRQVSGLKTAQVASLIEELRPIITMLPETLPDELVKHEALLTHADAILALHFPSTRVDIEKARERIGYEEMLELLYASELNRQDNAKLESWQIAFSEEDAKKFVSTLPFELTGAQKKAVWEVVQNFEVGEPMNRLLQGDVGAGKTVVAGMAAYLAAQQGFQSAIMAPTELLARQHAETLSRLLTPFNITVGLLIGSIPKKLKTDLKNHIEKGTIAITVGTHALIQEDVHFAKLGFVVIDEQHRFGVNQRQALLSKGQKMPHLLSMTATPIPRSLQLTVYGELEISLITERPKGRKPIITEIDSPNSRPQLYEKIDKEIEAGRQVYVVCPLIEENDESGLKSVEAEQRILKSTVFKHRTIGLLHGKLTPDEKTDVMQRFANGDLDILVSTTVVEVGVDVPNATVMIIEGAERFGLAQLHQLRGRVGRSEFQSYCYLIPSTSAKPSERLRELERSNDGFYLAEKDLELRGPGEIYGRAQSGALNLSMASITDTRLMYQVKNAISWCRSHNIDLLQYEKLRHNVEKYRRLTSLN